MTAQVVPLGGTLRVDGRERACLERGDSDFNMTAAETLEATGAAGGEVPAEFWAEREIEVTFKDSDMTWLLFLSAPASFRCDFRDHLGAAFGHQVRGAPPLRRAGAAAVYAGCSARPFLSVAAYASPPLATRSSHFTVRACIDSTRALPSQPERHAQLAPPFFRLEGTGTPWKAGGVRLALANNCTTAQTDPTFCPFEDPAANPSAAAPPAAPPPESPATPPVPPAVRPHNRSRWSELLRSHAGVFPSVEAEARFAFPGGRQFDPVSGEVVDSEVVDTSLAMSFDWDARWCGSKSISLISLFFSE